MSTNVLYSKHVLRHVPTAPYVRCTYERSTDLTRQDATTRSNNGQDTDGTTDRHNYRYVDLITAAAMPYYRYEEAKRTQLQLLLLLLLLLQRFLRLKALGSRLDRSTYKFGFSRSSQCATSFSIGGLQQAGAAFSWVGGLHFVSGQRIA